MFVSVFYFLTDNSIPKSLAAPSAFFSLKNTFRRFLALLVLFALLSHALPDPFFLSFFALISACHSPLFYSFLSPTFSRFIPLSLSLSIAFGHRFFGIFWPLLFLSLSLHSFNSLISRLPCSPSHSHFLFLSFDAISALHYLPQHTIFRSFIGGISPFFFASLQFFIFDRHRHMVGNWPRVLKLKGPLLASNVIPPDKPSRIPKRCENWR